MTQDNPNRKTLYLVGGTIAAAVVILLFLTQLGRGPSGGETDANTKKFAPNNKNNLPQAIEGLKPPEVEQSDTISQLGTGDPGAGSAESFEYESPDEEGRLGMRFRGGTTETLASGQIRIPDPQAWVYLSEAEVLYITADEVLVSGLALDVESGRLLGNVRLQIFRLPDNHDGTEVRDIRELELASATPSVVIESADLQYDRNLSAVSIQDRFTVRTERLALAGRGMALVFNEIEKRIEYLKIDERESIVYRGLKNKAEPNTADPGKANVQVAGEMGGGTLKSFADSSAANSTPPGIRDSLPEEIQYYEIALAGGVALTRGFDQKRISIMGEHLEAEFALGSRSVDTLLSSTAHPAPAPRQPSAVTFARENLSARTTPAVGNLRKSSAAQLGGRGGGRLGFGTQVVLAALLVGGEGMGGQNATGGSLASAELPQITPFELTFGSNPDFPLPLHSPSGIAEDDIVILGRGPLEVRPLAEKPGTLQDENDLHAVLTGTPVELRSADGKAFCGKVEYQGWNQVTQLLPTVNEAVEIKLTDGGTVWTAEPVVINSNVRTVVFTGGGTIDTPHENTLRADGLAPNATTTKRLDFSGGVTASWTDGLKLTFESTGNLGADDNPLGGGGGMGAVKAAEFTGKVRFEHSDGFALQADRLVAEFSDYEGMIENPTLTLITGYGNVLATSPEGAVTGDRLEVAFALDNPFKNPEPVPTIVEFIGNVVATDEIGNKLRMGYLRVDLLKPSELEAAQLAAGDREKENNERVRLITATGQVRIEMLDGGRAHADRLLAQPRAGTARLEGQTVIAAKDTMRLVTTWIALTQEKNEDGQAEMVVRTPSGVLVYLQREDSPKENDPNRRFRDDEDVWREIRERLDGPTNKKGAAGRTPDAPNSPAQAEAELRRAAAAKAHAVRIQWSKSMIFREGIIGKGEFWGDVLVESSPVPEEYNSIQADRLRFRLSGNPTPGQGIDNSPRIATVDGEPVVGTDALHGLDTDAFDLGLLGSGNRSRGGRTLMSLEAISESAEPARIQAKRYTEATRETPLTIFYLAGPIIEYFDIAEQLRVIGDGKMFLHDARPEKNPTAGTGTGEQRAQAQVSGKGSTLFKWTGSLLLKGIEQSMTIRDDVSIQHRPLNSTTPEMPEGGLDLWCQSFQAALGDEVGGDEIDALAMSGQVMGDLRMLDATDSVYVVTGRHRIAADQLHYESATKLAVLVGTADEPVSVERVDSPTSFEAERVLWDLFADSITVERPGAATVPGN